MAAEYLPSTGALYRRYVFGPGVDEPIVEYDGSGVRTWMMADERGSIVARPNDLGNMSSSRINSYDEYGIPGSGNVGRFQYTGQAYLYEIGLDYYKARLYSPTLGRFLQTDPIGYGDGMNWYAYTHNDPVNGSDPSGMDTGYHACTGSRIKTAQPCGAPGLTVSGNTSTGGGSGDGGGADGAGVGGMTGTYIGGVWNGVSTSIPGTSPYASNAGSLIRQYGGYYLDGTWVSVSGDAGAFSMGGGGGYLCITMCPSRNLTDQEKRFYRAFGLPRSVVNDAVLIQGLPPGPYSAGNVDAYTYNNDIYLAAGIGNYMAGPYWEGLLGHELFHVWQYQLGATFAEFGWDQVWYGHDNSPLEIPAIRFGRHICHTGGGTVCPD